MEKVIEGIQAILNTIGFGTGVLGGIGAGTESYGVAEQAVAGGTDAFVGVFTAIYNFISGIFGKFGVEIGSLEY